MNKFREYLTLLSSENAIVCSAYETTEHKAYWNSFSQHFSVVSYSRRSTYTASTASQS